MQDDCKMPRIWHGSSQLESKQNAKASFPCECIHITTHSLSPRPLNGGAREKTIRKPHHSVWHTSRFDGLEEWLTVNREVQFYSNHAAHTHTRTVPRCSIHLHRRSATHFFPPNLSFSRCCVCFAREPLLPPFIQVIRAVWRGRPLSAKDRSLLLMPVLMVLFISPFFPLQWQKRVHRACVSQVGDKDVPGSALPGSGQLLWTSVSKEGGTEWGQSNEPARGCDNCAALFSPIPIRTYSAPVATREVCCRGWETTTTVADGCFKRNGPSRTTDICQIG